jgi:hypothetical protein
MLFDKYMRRIITMEGKKNELYKVIHKVVPNEL